jgi:hypothetical protein
MGDAHNGFQDSLSNGSKPSTRWRSAYITTRFATSKLPLIKQIFRALNAFTPFSLRQYDTESGRSSSSQPTSRLTASAVCPARVGGLCAVIWIQATPRSSSFCSVLRAPMSTLKVDITVTRCRRHQLEVTKLKQPTDLICFHHYVLLRLLFLVAQSKSILSLNRRTR